MTFIPAVSSRAKYLAALVTIVGIFFFSEDAFCVARPGIELSYGVQSSETEQQSPNIDVKLASVYQVAVTPSVGFAAEGSQPLEFRLATTALMTGYRRPATATFADSDEVALFRFSAELTKEFKRFSFALGGGYGQRSVAQSTDESVISFSKVRGASVTAGCNFIAIGTTQKALSFGARVRKEFGGNEVNGVRVQDGYGLELFSGFEFTAGTSLRLSYSMENLESTMGVLRNREIMVGLRIYKQPQADFGRTPLDY